MMVSTAVTAIKTLAVAAGQQYQPRGETGGGHPVANIPDWWLSDSCGTQRVQPWLHMLFTTAVPFFIGLWLDIRVTCRDQCECVWSVFTLTSNNSAVVTDVYLLKIQIWSAAFRFSHFFPKQTCPMKKKKKKKAPLFSIYLVTFWYIGTIKSMPN